MLRRIAVAGVVALAFASTGTATAQAPDELPRAADDGVVDSPLEIHALHDEQHGGEDGHLPPTSDNVELVGQSDIAGAGPGRVADVASYGNYAYLTVRSPDTCTGENAAGVAIFDISDPSGPVQVEFIDATAGSFPGEGAQVVDLRTDSFQGQVLVFNNEICALGGEGGVSLWDVTDPGNPVVLTENAGDPDGAIGEFTQIHSSFAWQAGHRAFVVLVDNEEFTDVDIFEITDPRNPEPIAELDLNDLDVLQEDGTPLGEGAFLHDMVVKKVGGTWTMLLSYWDGGWALLDVDDPANPAYIADSNFPDPDPLTGVSPPTGNAHQAEFSADNELIIGTSEDFDPYRLEATDESGTEFSGTMGIAIEPGSTLNAATVYVGQGCDAGPAIPQAQGRQIALIERGTCAFTEKVANASEAGYVAAMVFNSQAAIGGTCTGLVNMSVEGNIPAFFVGRDTAFRFTGLAYDDAACLDADPQTGAIPESLLGTVVETLTISSVFDSWGYVHLLDADTLEQIDTYAVDEATDPAHAFGSGDLSVHEVAVDPTREDIAYLSYYAAGLRVIRYDEESGITEVGSYIAEGGNNFWGIEVHQAPKGNFEWVIGLLDELEGDDRLASHVAASLLDRLAKAEDAADTGSEIRAIGYLQQASARARNQIKGDAQDLEVRATVVSALQELVDHYQALEDGEPEGGQEPLVLASDRDSGLWIFRYTGR